MPEKRVNRLIYQSYSRRILNIPREYLEAVSIGHQVFSPIFQFENGLRLAVHKFMVTCYGTDWWELSLKLRLPDIYNYVETQKLKKSYMPWIGDSTRVPLLPIHLITLGQLEQIIVHYKSDCIPELFPTIDFFTGHMEVIKRVRNFFSHMYPCITTHDVVIAKREIMTLCDHLRSKV
jgi:hypothetical protein